MLCTGPQNKLLNELFETFLPQGSILGPLLFPVYINDLNKVHDVLDPIMFANHTTIFIPL